MARISATSKSQTPGSRKCSLTKRSGRPLVCPGSRLKTLGRSRASFGRLDFTIARRRVCHERFEQFARSLRHLIHCAIENFFVRFGRFRKAAEFTNELQRRRTDLFLGRRRFEVMKGLNISTHAVLLRPQSEKLRDLCFLRFFPNSSGYILECQHNQGENRSDHRNTKGAQPACNSDGSRQP